MVLDTKQKIVVHYIADGEVQEFNFNFQIFEAGDLDVYLDETLTDSGYNVTINENSYGGKVVFAEPPSNGTRITIIRNLEIKRTSDFQEGGAFRAKVINHELDYQVATLEQLDEKIGRSMIYPPYAQEGVSTSLPLPSAGKALVWNQEASALTNSQISPDNLISEASSAKDIAQNCALQAQNSAASAQTAEMQAQASAQAAVEASESAQIAAVKASFGNIGDIKYTIRTDVPNGGAWCDGAEYTKEAFPDVYQMLVDEKLQSTTIDEFDSMVSAQGYCELFGLDTSNEKFKVPNLPNQYVINIDDTAPVLGSGEYLGIQAKKTDGSWTSDNKFYVSSGFGIGFYPTETGIGGTSANIIRLNTDSSKSGIVTDTSGLSKVITLKAYVVMYSSAAEASEVQAAEFINIVTEVRDELANKANTDFSNIDDSFDCVVESDSNYIKFKSGKLIQWQNLASGAGTARVVNLIKPYANTSYSVMVTVGNVNSGSPAYITMNVTSRTTTNFTTGEGGGTCEISWLAIGQGA